VKAVTTDSKISEGLYESLGVDTKKLKKSISAEITRGIASGMSHSEIAQNIARYANAPLGRAKTIVRTESHRIQQASKFDAQNAAKAKGANVVKQWNSTLDGDTRSSHRRLDGQIREIDEPFEMGGKKAMYPGGFGDPAEDCNCRCQLLQRARIALDEEELKTLQERAEFFGLDKSDDLEDFKKKYLKAAEKEEVALENTGKSGIIKEKDTTKGIGVQYFANKGILKQSDAHLKKSIASWTENIAVHQAKIADPEKYDSDWNSKSEAHKAGLIKHWQKEIQNFQNNINDANDELNKRGQSK
jgi:uncharacterized protein with gpF-like domain